MPVSEDMVADEAIAPLVACALRHGLSILGSAQGGYEDEEEHTGYSPAHIVFPSAEEALEFLLQSAQLASFTVGEKMLLTVHRPLTGDDPGGKVIWHPGFTPELTAFWTAR